MASNTTISSRLLALEEQVVEMRTSFEQQFSRLFDELEKQRAENKNLKTIIKNFQSSQTGSGIPDSGIEHEASTDGDLFLLTPPETATFNEAAIVSGKKDFAKDMEDSLAVLQRQNLEAEKYIAKLERELESSEVVRQDLMVHRSALQKELISDHSPTEKLIAAVHGTQNIENKTPASDDDPILRQLIDAKLELAQANERNVILRRSICRTRKGWASWGIWGACSGRQCGSGEQGK